MFRYWDGIAAAVKDGANLNDEQIRRNQRKVSQAFERYVLGLSIGPNSENTDNWGWTNSWLRFLRANIHVDLAITACALERHRLKHGSFPERLDQLVPEFMKEVLKDRVDGKPLRYSRRQDGSFTLYSIGANEEDEAGKLPDLLPQIGKQGFSGEWVWTYEPERLPEE